MKQFLVVLVLAFALCAATPAHAQGIEARSVVIPLAPQEAADLLERLDLVDNYRRAIHEPGSSISIQTAASENLGLGFGDWLAQKIVSAMQGAAGSAGGWFNPNPMRQARWIGDVLTNLPFVVAAAEFGWQAGRYRDATLERVLAAARGPEMNEPDAVDALAGWAGGVVLAGGFLGLFVVGVGLAFIVPAIPYIYWVLGLLGFLISVAEALVAVPVWISSFAHPEGDGLRSKYSSQGWFLLAKLALQPILMLTGLVVAMVLVGTLGAWINVALLHTLDSSTGWNLVSVIAFVVVYFVVMLAVVHHSFELVARLPGWVFEWIGFSTDRGEQRARQRVMGVASSGKQALGSAGNRGLRAGKRARKTGQTVAGEITKGGSNDG